jgi:thymidine phosphorylase
VREAIDTLRGEGPEDLWQLTLELGTHQLLLAGLAASAEEARERLTSVRASGAGARKLEELIEAQHGDPRVVEDTSLLPTTAVVEVLCAEQTGWVATADARAIGEAALALGAGRRRKGDPVDPAVGIVMRVRIGDQVEEGAPLAEIHARVGTLAADAAQRLREAITVSPEAVPAHDERYEVIGA